MERNIRNNRFERRATESARAITKAKTKKQNIILATAAIALIAVVAAGFLVVGSFNVSTGNTALPASVSTNMNKNIDKASQNIAAQPAVQNIAVQSDNDNSSNYQSNAQVTYVQTSGQAVQDTQQSDGNIEVIGGERVYIDGKRTAPANTGSAAHYYAYGKTSYGFDWDYDTDNDNFILACNYNFDLQQYDFTFYGSAEGTANVTLYYNTDNDTQIPVDLTVTVDSALNTSVY